jgi:phosphoribosyl 1,2-cyclic phosphate phosphodiesterase
MKVTVLGCGTSAGVPQIGCDCPVCRSADPRNRRLRASILVEAEGRRILFDTGPDLREQCLRADIRAVDAVVYTHAHADHVHGIDDLRGINNIIGRSIPAYAHASVFERIVPRFPYAFRGGQGDHGYWRPELERHDIDGPFEIAGLPLVPFEQQHGRGRSWGFRIGGFGYSTDTNGLDGAAFAALRGVEVWIVDALRERPHPSHAHLALALSWIERVAPQRAYFTHMNHEVDYADWSSRLPDTIRPAHDGLVIEL